jgi:hypothetical protein
MQRYKMVSDMRSGWIPTPFYDADPLCETDQKLARGVLNASTRPNFLAFS